jgi:hypothetical protein
MDKIIFSKTLSIFLGFLVIKINKMKNIFIS